MISDYELWRRKSLCILGHSFTALLSKKCLINSKIIWNFAIVRKNNNILKT